VGEPRGLVIDTARGVDGEESVMDAKKAEALTPQQVVEELDRYIVGQQKAKRALAIALRNRYRRSLVPEELREEITPKNILLIGPTGVGKTELARRLAKLVDAPFIKVEATKFTEVGYVGRDVESIIRDLVETSVGMVHDSRQEEVRSQAEDLANEKLISYLLTTLDAKEAPSEGTEATREAPDTARDRAELGREGGEAAREPARASTRVAETRKRTEGARQRRRRKALAKMLADRKLEEQMVEIELEQDDGGWPTMEFTTTMSSEEMTDAFQDFVAHMTSQRRRSRVVSVKEARRLLTEEETNKLIDWDQVVDQAVEKVEQSAIVFIDEIDKIVGRGNDAGPDVSGEGVQRDLLPIVEGSTVNSRYGPVKTDHILFVAAGAFQRVRPSDLIPELQGRFPNRVELKPLTYQDYLCILSQPANALTRQYQALLRMEDVELEFSQDGLAEIARRAMEMNERVENIGARRLHTIIERVLEDINFSASEHAGMTLVVDRAYVVEKLADVGSGDDLSRFIL
jgi:ATP-dependent HslUV protease ATP-binding subunit HslU